MLNSKSIGNKIAAARKKIGLSQSELAQKVSINAHAVGKWERGESMPDITTLNHLAEILGVDLNYFSDSFQSIETVATPVEPSERITDVFPKKKIGLNWNMSAGNWVDADFSGLKNLKEKFSASNMNNCKFLGSELTDLTLQGNNIENCDFSGSDMRNSKIQASDLSKSVFTECSLIDTEFEASEIYNCNFTNANFAGSEFKASEFRNNVIERATWKLTSFYTSHLANVVFDGPIEDCVFENCSFSKVTFKNATLTNTFFKANTNLKKVTFIDCQADRMTHEFLKSGKANLTGITLL
jgi:uncharacterized protein YjbI with pentapeptide repeats